MKIVTMSMEQYSFKVDQGKIDHSYVYLLNSTRKLQESIISIPCQEVVYITV